MANKLDQNPLVIDTTGDTLTKRGIVAIRWVGATTAGHTCVIKDGTDRVIFAASATGNGGGDSFVPLKPLIVMDTINVTTLASGTVYIYS